MNITHLLEQSKNAFFSINLKYHIIERRFILLYSLILWLVTLPLTTPRLGPGLDQSWVIAIHTAIKSGYQFGTETIFNYGPLGHLNIGPVVFDHNLWMISFFFRAFIHLFFVLSITWFITRCRAGWPVWIITFFIVYIFSPITDAVCYKIQISAILMCWILTLGEYQKEKEYILFTVIGGLLAVSFLIKVNTLFLSGWILLITGIFWFFNKKKSLSAYILLPLSFGGFLLLFWIESNQKIENFIPYFFSSLDLISGYNEAMAISGSNTLLLFACFMVILSLLLILYPGQTKNQSCLFIIFSSFLLFASFKHGFVRQDNHIWIFLQIWGLIVSLLFLIRLPDLMKNSNLFSIILYTGISLMTGVIILIGPPINDPQILHTDYVYEPINLINLDFFDKEVLHQKENIRMIHPVPVKFLTIIQNKTIDIFPWEISVLWAYNLSWTNRPVIQSQNVYTHNLDNLNNIFLTSKNRPDFLLYQYDSIDGRYQPGDEPATFRAVISGYDLVGSAGEYLLLKTNHSDYQLTMKKQCEKTGLLNEWIPIPNNAHFMYASANISYSIPGLVKKQLFRPDPLFIRFQTQDGRITSKYRLIPDLIQNGLFITEIVDNQEVFQLLLNTSILQENLISAFAFSSDNPWQYNPNFTITMFESGSEISKAEKKDPQDIWMISHDISDKRMTRKITVSLNESLIKCIFIHPPGTGETVIDYESIIIPEKASIQFSTAFDPRVNNVMSDGVVFHLYIKQKGNRDYNEIWNYSQLPGNWNDIGKNHIINLGDYGEETVDIRFSASSGFSGNNRYDWALIGNPLIIKNGSS